MLIKVGERSSMGLCDIYNHWKEMDMKKLSSKKRSIRIELHSRGTLNMKEIVV